MFLQQYIIFKYIILNKACKIMRSSFNHTTIHVSLFGLFYSCMFDRNFGLSSLKLVKQYRRNMQDLCKR